MNKQGISISINMIIIVIIALVTLGLVLGFVTGAFKDLKDKVVFPELEIEPTADDPITFVPLKIQRGNENRMTIGFYNDERATITEDILPLINCQNLADVSITVVGLNIQIGSWKQYAAIVTIPNETPSGQYSCRLVISQTEKSFFMEVN
ncbi:MAG: hypothetical protein ABIH82_00220 [Candidatus Woesearchaeota archaeon]